ncbi:alpha-1,2-fucosyltransferase [Parabacteroides sp. W1-Q-101]|uniref:alpha-1,2-fucosyltransferase n=1 Tax=Parabacteroides TaxID=375288 RepID=UPI00202E694E|nr:MULTISPECIES: alpha-1,2-fucosyltransferase [unclassified Parabacteroides]MCM0717987.1 alpha-1,2-fucosyltransferase [Parabacteroides sp. W1-Q-101]
MTKNFLIEKKPYRIAIVYLAIGKYDVLWDEFYRSCEEYLFPDAVKHYFVFTDSERLLALDLPNVSLSFRGDGGWAMNALAKYDCMLSVREQLKTFDFLFYINANYKIQEPIYCNEILATAENGYLSVLSFDFFADRHPDTYTYDRNPRCRAYIPYGKGTRYYQACFYGGRTSEMLALAIWCAESTRIDLSNGIMALWHDESYLNKYLLERHPKVISMAYCKPEEFDGASKAILRDKNKILGKTNIDRLKQVFTNPSLSYLRDKKLQIKPCHWIERMGRLGNQMFQYAFLLGIQHTNPETVFYLSTPVALPDASDDSNNLEKVFDIPADHLAEEELTRQIMNTPASCIRRVNEPADSLWREVDTDWSLLSIYQGYWQTDLYFKKIAPVIRKAFRFDTDRLNPKSSDLAEQIHSCLSVSIHVRRGDYLSEKNRQIYGDICTVDYYRNAVEWLKKRLPKEAIRFYVFSDDPDWVKENLPLEHAVVVDWNQGVDSWQDMYLMSVCRHHIIANSSFSWWGAWLNPREDKMVIAPYRWYKDRVAPDILPEGWIALHPSGYRVPPKRIPAEKAEQILKSQQQCINRYKSGNQSMPDRYVLKNPMMGKVISLYTYARFVKDQELVERADRLLDVVIDVALAASDDGMVVCSLGCGLIYLLRTGFVEGDEDEILSDIDWRLTMYVMNRPKNMELLCGWIHYLTLRVEQEGEEVGQNIKDLNKQNLIGLLDYLENNPSCVDLLAEDIRKIDVMGIYPERTKRLLDKELSGKELLAHLDHIENQDVTFVIPVRVDSPERSANLDVVLEQLSHREQASVLLLEADTKPLYKLKKAYSNVRYFFVEDPDPVFYRTKYLNQLLREAKTELVGIWDTDVIVPDTQIDKALRDLMEGKAVMSYPYDGRFYICTAEESTYYRQGGLPERWLDQVNRISYCISNSVGGAFLVRKSLYLEAGGENEAFYGWGMEDQERIRRMFILGLPVTQVDGSLFHLFHPRNENSRYRDKEAEYKSRQEFLKICRMTSEELRCFF